MREIIILEQKELDEYNAKITDLQKKIKVRLFRLFQCRVFRMYVIVFLKSTWKMVVPIVIFPFITKA